VDDYFTLHLRYPDGLNVLVSGSLLVADPPPAFVLHGTAGSFRKSRGDVQEAQLKAGTSPRSPGYGVEPAGEAGTLTLVDPAGASKTTRALPTPQGDYMHLFEAAYRTIRHGAAYPVREEEAQWQVALLEQAPTGW
jgi:predicted dehydrogenase